MPWNRSMNTILLGHGPVPFVSASPALGINLAWVILWGFLSLAAVMGLLLRPSFPRAHGVLLISIAALVYFFLGFGLMFGGAAGRYDALGSLSALAVELPSRELGLVGGAGFALSGAAYDPGVYALFTFHLVFALISIAITLGAWASHLPRWFAALWAAAYAGVLYPILGHWVWGGGWLATLGIGAGLGHGFVDAGGSFAFYVAGCALAGLSLGHDYEAADSEDPWPAHGLALAFGGVAAAILGAASTATDMRTAVIAANTLLAGLAALAVGAGYTWFVIGEPYLSLSLLAGLCGLMAIAGPVAFVPAWMAVTIGLVAGLIFPFAHYIGERFGLRSAVAVAALTGGLLGILAVGLVSDGRYGAGWNGVGPTDYLGVAGLGVTGLFPAGLVPSDPGQIHAQILGAVVLGIVSLCVPWLLTTMLRRVAR